MITIFLDSLRVFRRSRHHWKLAFLICAIVAFMDVVASANFFRVSDCAAHGPMKTKFGPVSGRSLEYVVILCPAPHIQAFGASNDFIHLLKFERQFNRIDCSARSDQYVDIRHDQIWKIEISGQGAFDKSASYVQSEIASWSVATIFPTHTCLVAFDLVSFGIDNWPKETFGYKNKCTVRIDECVPAETHLATGGGGRYASENQGGQHGDKAQPPKPGLKPGPPDSIFRRLGHAPLFAQIGSLVVFGFLTVGGIWLGLRYWWLDSRPWRGCCLLLIGLLCGSGGVALCVAYAG